ncbi:hypothetical protein JCM11491_005766 [Sporobolomyces phaffii]
MQTLSIRTDFPSAQPADFAVLPSPSTFFLSNALNYPSPTFDQYPISATDYHQHFLPAPAPSEEPDLVQQFPSSQASSCDDSLAEGRSPSPASSFPSTPTGSPIPQNLAIEHAGQHQHAHSMNKARQRTLARTLRLSFAQLRRSEHASVINTDCLVYCSRVQVASMVQFERFDNLVPSQQQEQFIDCCASQFSNDSANFELPPSHHNYPRQPSYAPFQPHPVANVQQSQFYAAGGGGGPGGIVYANRVPQQVYAQPSPIPYSIGPLSHANNVSYAVPHSAPGPAAIETPHGTYYFVPNVNMAPSPPAPSSIVASNEPVQLPSPPSMSSSPPLDSSLPAPGSAAYSGYVQLANGLTAGVAIAQATTAARSVNGTTATVVIGDQKIRLPVGQGKRGSTKRPTKKDQVKKFICPHPGCGRAFARNFNMQSHHKSHLGIREFNCPHCPKKFSRRHDRARHCSAVHDSRVDREGNVTGGHTASTCSESPSAEEYDDSFDEDKNFELVDFAG